MNYRYALPLSVDVWKLQLGNKKALRRGLFVLLATP